MLRVESDFLSPGPTLNSRNNEQRVARSHYVTWRVSPGWYMFSTCWADFLTAFVSSHKALSQKRCQQSFFFPFKASIKCNSKGWTAFNCCSQWLFRKSKGFCEPFDKQRPPMIPEDPSLHPKSQEIGNSCLTSVLGHIVSDVISEHLLGWEWC